jgi:hypothetical protein
LQHLDDEKFYKQTNRHWSLVDDETSGTNISVLHVRSQHAMMQAIGYAKYSSEPW